MIRLKFEAVKDREKRIGRYVALPLACFLINILMCAVPLGAQGSDDPQPAPAADLQQRVQVLEAEVAQLKATLSELQAHAQPPAVQPNNPAADPQASSPATTNLTASDRSTLDFLHDTSINLTLDGYYEYNFNRPVGRVNLLRAYDVLSNSFSLNQASLILEHAPDPAAGRRFGARLDLQFGQATETLQGSAANEPRPQVYRNVFQAYGTYVAPIAKGLTIDFGKFASAMGYEDNYTKDQFNYSRSYFFNFLPFYHMGFRNTLAVNDKLSYQPAI